jgi:hypothetical protein
MSKGVKLSRKDVLKAIIVARGCENNAICSKGKGRKGRAIFVKPSHKFGCQMLGIRSASPISKEKECPSSLKGLAAPVNQLAKRRLERA